jgi:hypothetical protein
VSLLSGCCVPVCTCACLVRGVCGNSGAASKRNATGRHAAVTRAPKNQNWNGQQQSIKHTQHAFLSEWYARLVELLWQGNCGRFLASVVCPAAGRTNKEGTKGG